MLPARIRRPLRSVVAILRDTFGKGLVGVYVYGSLTQRAFDPAHSDIDILVVVKRSPTRTEFRRLGELLAIAGTEDEWIVRTQMQLLVQDRLLRSDTRGALFQFGKLKRSGSDGNPIVWVNVLESGVTLFGADPRALLPRITDRMVRAALVREMGYLRAEVTNASSMWRNKRSYRTYAVLTVCRILCTWQNGQVVSKPDAARWALRELPPRWHGLVRAAGGKRRGRAARLPLARLLSFVEFGRETLRAGAFRGNIA